MQINGIKINGIEASEAKLNGNIVYQKIKAIEFTSCPFPTSWTAVTNYTEYKASNSYGDWTINAYGAYNYNYPAKNAFDGNSETFWRGTKLTYPSGNGAITISFSGAICPKEIYIKHSCLGNNMNATIQGYKIKTNSWETLCKPRTQIATIEETFQITTENFYNKFKIHCYSCATDNLYPYINEFKITKGNYIKI